MNSPKSTMAFSESNGPDHVVELIVRDIPPPPPPPPPPSSSDDSRDNVNDPNAPLLSRTQRPKINIFTASYPRRKPRAIPLFETAFTRCTIILILSYLWLRRSEQPLFGTSNVRIILLLRALAGCVSMSSFVYCFQRLPFSQAVVLNSTTPIMASIIARFFLREKLKIADIACLACSFFGVLFFFREMLATQGQSVKVAGASDSNARPSHHIFEILVGIFSSIIGGTSYCLIRAGAKASDQPLLTVFSFGVLACPAMGICSYIFEDFVLPGFRSILLMLVLGILAFFAEVLLARGLQLERMGKVANIQYIEAALTQFWSLALTLLTPAFDHLAGILLIVVSVCCTMYIGPDKEIE
ncbi:uncharacterized protein [Cicer arietinum]|uniref:uncharacterized protein isoform X2 n=1 Tax=Cicer arietinum TaxID=3827 RepID=UPI003CC5785F